MNKELFINKILAKKEIKDYTYVILFFVVSSFFIFFAIKPAVLIAFSLKRQVLDLQSINTIYEKNILKLVDIQSKLENTRNKTYLLEEAVPKNPEMRVLIDNIKQVASSEGIIINDLSLSSVNLKNDRRDQRMKPLKINIEAKSDFYGINNFMKRIIEQKRIKVINNLKILRENDSATNSANLKVKIEIEGYYL
jgi:Tfp pilus assembly protein PilO